LSLDYYNNIQKKKTMREDHWIPKKRRQSSLIQHQVDAYKIKYL